MCFQNGGGFAVSFSDGGGFEEPNLKESDICLHLEEVLHSRRTYAHQLQLLQHLILVQKSICT